jgi:mannose-6-phosphate isomerase
MARILEPNILQRFYRGGSRIAEFRKMPVGNDDAPEDWVGSTTCVHGEDVLGLTMLPGGRSLREAIARDPLGYLGADHAASRGDNPGLLVKLLDAGERLPVHCHPDRAFARRHLNSRYGKTEAWVVMGAGGVGGTVHLGFGDDVPMQRLRRWVGEQDGPGLLAAMNEVVVRPGEAWLIPAGVPHAIGEGLLIVELQEPTDFSVLLEWRGYPIDGERDGHLGLGFDVALEAVDRSGWAPERLETLRGRRGDAERVLPAAADPFFGLEWVTPDGSRTVAAGFAIIVAVAGTGSITWSDGELGLHGGQTALMPHSAGAWEVSGDLEVLVCRPPRPQATW